MLKEVTAILTSFVNAVHNAQGRPSGLKSGGALRGGGAGNFGLH